MIKSAARSARITMKLSQLKSLETQLSDFVEQFTPMFGRSERRYWCKLYLTGLLLDGERKSIEPLASRLSVATKLSAIEQESLVEAEPLCDGAADETNSQRDQKIADLFGPGAAQPRTFLWLVYEAASAGAGGRRAYL
jgi:hypothetical protein